MAAVTTFDPGDELAEGMDPHRCVECLAVGDSCDFHAGFAAGWDACSALVASVVEDDAHAEEVPY